MKYLKTFLVWASVLYLYYKFQGPNKDAVDGFIAGIGAILTADLYYRKY